MEDQKEKRLADIREKLKGLLVENLSLEDVTPDEIKDDEILFGDGLGLDSLDAVEIVVLLQRNFGLEVKDMEKGREIFYSIDTLARYVYENTKNKS
ncbi:MAG: acyl carrier protein [Desulfobacterales bacterium]|nr:acyl carrier protein [Desulfobacterales bacterium]